MLLPYSDDHFSLLEQWVPDKNILFQYSGTYFHYPLSKEQIQDYLEKYPERRFYIGHTQKHGPYAFGEIIPKGTQPPRLARLLIGDPDLRGKGLGQLFVKELIIEATRLFHSRALDLFVLANNFGAIRCYQKVGFHFLPEGDFELQFEGKTFPVRKMRLQLEPEHSSAP